LKPVFPYQPPAKARFNLFGISVSLLIQKQVDLQLAVKKYLNAQEVVIADAWVNLLSEGLRSLTSEGKNEVLLPAYSCNEFSKAILLAGLKPVYFPLDAECKLQIEAIYPYLNKNTLALLAVSNTGVTSNLSALRQWCDNQQLWMVEDAGYSFLGKNSAGQNFGSFGHTSIINMSEGKIIPCGGAAWVCNTKDLLENSVALRTRLNAAKPKSLLVEWLQLAFYSAGSSSFGFAVYQFLRRLGAGDLKAKLTNEPSRVGEDYQSGNLLFSGDEIVLEGNHLAQLQNIQLRPWNRARQLCGLQIMENEVRERELRQQKQTDWLAILPKKLHFLPLEPQAMPVKLPFVMPVKLSTSETEWLTLRGVKKQYPPSWPMASFSFPNDQQFYASVYTLPVHLGITKAHMHQISKFMDKLTNEYSTSRDNV